MFAELLLDDSDRRDLPAVGQADLDEMSDAWVDWLEAGTLKRAAGGPRYLRLFWAWTDARLRRIALRDLLAHTVAEDSDAAEVDVSPDGDTGDREASADRDLDLVVTLVAAPAAPPRPFALEATAA
jgi:hypothetical protein